jgi:oxygen-independent coproporphyrinogen-3 oxidase
MAEAICREAVLASNYLDKQDVNTIYFGGGTPSLLSEKELSLIMDALHKHFNVSPTAEITLEANPEDLSKEQFPLLLKNKINRLSIGVQSLNDNFLHFLNRNHSGTDAYRSIHSARESGFENISVDLIYGIPHVSHDLWMKDLRQILSLDVQHISSYCLTIEPGTVFGNWKKQGKLKVAEDEFSATQYELLQGQLYAAGFESYEISNACKPGYMSRHNSSYWTGSHYLGLGPGAHSFNGNSRRYNIRNNPGYLKSMGKNIIPFTTELLDRRDKANEYLLTSLRTSWGCDTQKLVGDFGVSIQHISPVIERMSKEKLVSLEGGILKLTQKGKLLADFITSELFI